RANTPASHTHNNAACHQNWLGRTDGRNDDDARTSGPDTGFGCGASVIPITTGLSVLPCGPISLMAIGVFAATVGATICGVTVTFATAAGRLAQRGTKLKMLAALPGENGSTSRATTTNHSAQRQRGVSCFRNTHCASKTSSTSTAACPDSRPNAS